MVIKCFPWRARPRDEPRHGPWLTHTHSRGANVGVGQRRRRREDLAREADGGRENGTPPHGLPGTSLSVPLVRAPSSLPSARGNDGGVSEGVARGGPRVGPRGGARATSRGLPCSPLGAARPWAAPSECRWRLLVPGCRTRQPGGCWHKRLDGSGELDRSARPDRGGPRPGFFVACRAQVDGSGRVQPVLVRVALGHSTAADWASRRSNGWQS